MSQVHPRPIAKKIAVLEVDLAGCTGGEADGAGDQPGAWSSPNKRSHCIISQIRQAASARLQKELDESKARKYTLRGRGWGCGGGKSVGRAGEGFKHETGSVPHFEAQAGAERCGGATGEGQGPTHKLYGPTKPSRFYVNSVVATEQFQLAVLRALLLERLADFVSGPLSIFARLLRDVLPRPGK